jgi:hypothetical protein
VEEEVPGNGGWAKDGEAEEPARVAGESAAGRKGTRRSEKAKVSEEALLTRSSEAKKPMNACVHTHTNSQTPSTRRRGPGWRIHGGVEDTKLSTNKQHSLSKVTRGLHPTPPSNPRVRTPASPTGWAEGWARGRSREEYRFMKLCRSL